jgi:two-component system chemotaxis sensor kinase CheA
MKIDLNQFRQTFLNESAEHIQTIESGLLELRSNPRDEELLNSIFRSAHSIKGGAGSFGLENLVRITHALENLLDRLRSLELEVTEEIVAAMIESVDILRTLLEGNPEAAMPAEAVDLVERLEMLMQRASAASDAGTSIPLGAATAATPVQAAVPEEEMAFYRIEFRPDRELFSSGTNPIVLLRNLAELGRVSATEMHAADLPALRDLDPARCYLGWTIEIGTTRSEQELREVFEFVEHLAEITFRRIDQPAPRSHKDVIPQRPSIAAPADALTPPEGRTETRAAKKPTAGEATSIRVSTEKVDRLIDLVGELVIAHVMTAQMVERFSPGCLPKLREAVEAMERNTRELHERVMAIRMLPVGRLFHRYVRTVYDIAQATGKAIELVTSGEETEIDKGMLELLGDPLTHIIRNSADHGIELPEVRLAAGKPALGTIRLRAFHRAGRIVIEVSDDGAGINLVRVREKAIRQGLIAADTELSDEQGQMLIFEPGFSTRDEVSDLSGRGVGMDVVRQNVQQMNGTVSLSSQPGRGTTLTIELPLTLAILEGLLVGVRDRTLVIPLLAVVETVSPRPGQVQRVAEKGDIVIIRDESIPLLRLDRFLGLPVAHAQGGGARTLVVVVEAGHKKIGLMVDELLGQQQVVVKSLEKHLRKVDGLMGATILGDGCVAPIVDVACLGGMNLFALDRGKAALNAGLPAIHPQQFTSTSAERGESANAVV